MGQRDRMFKVLVVGDATVGKTSLVQRYANDSFNRHYKSTVGGERGSGGGVGVGMGSPSLRLSELRGAPQLSRRAVGSGGSRRGSPPCGPRCEISAQRWGVWKGWVGGDTNCDGFGEVWGEIGESPCDVGVNEAAESGGSQAVVGTRRSRGCGGPSARP